MVRLSPTVAPKTLRTQQATGDSALEVRLVVDSHTTPRLQGTVVLMQAGSRAVRSVNIAGTESPDGIVTLTLPQVAPLTWDSVTLSGRVVADRLVLLGDKSERASFLDSLVFRPVTAASAGTGLVVVERGDSGLTASRGAVAQRLKLFLRALLVSQEAYFADYTRYADSMPKLRGMITPPDSVSVMLTLTREGWSGTARHVSGLTCHTYMGATPPMAEGRPMGQPWCD